MPDAMERATERSEDCEADIPAAIARRLSPAQRRALLAMAATRADEEWAVPFRAIAATGLIQQKDVRRSVRALARKGITEHRRGLWSDEGPAGSGYGFTPLGMQVRAALVDLEAAAHA